MKLPESLMRHAWIAVLAGALALVGAVDRARIQRVQTVTALDADDARPDPKSPTGWADGKRWLLPPEHVDEAFESIELTQQMLAKGEWRIRHIDYENAPAGREVYSATPYRWWLAVLARLDHAFYQRPLGQSVERAALVAGPLLHLFFLAAAGLFVARRFGAGAASVLLIGLAVMFPLASAFLPAIATDHGLAQLCLFWSVLLLAADLAAPRRSRRAYFISGAAGGCALWLSVTSAAPVLLAIVGGAMLAAVVGGRRRAAAPDDRADLPRWRTWGAGGALACIIGYSLEYLPGHGGWDLRVNHPLFGLAWLGVAELLYRLAGKVRTGQWATKRSEWVVMVAALGAIAPLAVVLSFVRDWDFVAGDLFSYRLSDLPGSPVADNFARWVTGTPASAPLFATVLPILLFAPAAWALFSRQTAAGLRRAIAFAVVPALVTLSLACHHLRWWTAFDGTALVLLVATMAAVSRRVRWICAAIMATAGAVGLVELWPGPALQPDRPDLTHAEVRGLYERGLAHWIADRAGPDSVTVLAPPLTTSSFCFYGGLRGLGTPGWQNRDGLSTSYRIASSTRTDDTFALLNQAGVSFVVLPSWETTLETMASLGAEEKATFIGALHQTAGAVFHWLRPLPYNPPAVSGFGDSSVLVFQVSDEANPAVVESRVVEYLVEMHQMTQAAVASHWLQRYPADIGAQVALARYAKAAGDEEEFAKVFKSVVSYVQVGADRRLPWDRRISLAVVLAIGGKEDLSRAQVQRCLNLFNPRRARELTTGSLFRLLVLARHFGLEIPDAKTREAATKLLPPELRTRL